MTDDNSLRREAEQLRMGESWGHQKIRGLLKWLAALVALLYWTMGVWRYFPLDKIWATVAVCAGVLVYAFYEKTLINSQRKKNKWLEENYDRIIAEASKGRVNVFLYLRSFKSAKPKDLIKDGVELPLSEVLRFDGFFIALGDQIRSVGAAKIVRPEQQWQEDALQLMELAKVIFFMPGPSTSALWELRQIAQRPNLMEKTVWLMPSERHRRWLRKGDDRVDWMHVSEIAKSEFGISFPEFNSRHACAFIVHLGKPLYQVQTARNFTESIGQILDAYHERGWHIVGKELLRDVCLSSRYDVRSMIRAVSVGSESEAREAFSRTRDKILFAS